MIKKKQKLSKMASSVENDIGQGPVVQNERCKRYIC